MDLFDHGQPFRYRWALPYPVLMGGVRPNEMDWYRLSGPEWYVGEGWALTPEAAGVAHEDHRGPGIAPIRGWVRRHPEPITMLVGGRNLGSTSSRIEVSVAARRMAAWEVAPGFFLQMIPLPPRLDENAGDYLNVSISADSDKVAIEQFDARPSAHVQFGFGDGWQEQEYDASSGRRWRWLSERGQLRVRGAAQPVVLHIEGESPRKYFPRPSRFVVRIGDRMLLEKVIDADFSLEATIPFAAGGEEHVVTLETDQFFVPAERSRRTADRRHLGLRVFTCRVTSVS
jgi:hypothetical protein